MDINGTKVTATLVNNSSTEELFKMLKEGPLTIEMEDYASMEKVGSIGTNLSTNDKQTTTKAGDLILYLGDKFVIYYENNSWKFTRLGKINDVSQNELKKILGSGDATVTLSLD
nr:cyclophilin-like fold protein [Clostridium sp. DSM 17811]